MSTDDLAVSGREERGESRSAWKKIDVSNLKHLGK
jgi:hypothetical protein